MSIWGSRFSAGWFGSDPYKHEAVHKKDDDISIKMAEQWVVSHPIEVFSRWRCEALRQYAAELFRDLKRVPINSSSIRIIKVHLVILLQ